MVNVASSVPLTVVLFSIGRLLGCLFLVLLGDLSCLRLFALEILGFEIGLHWLVLFPTEDLDLTDGLTDAFSLDCVSVAFSLGSIVRLSRVLVSHLLLQS